MSPEPSETYTARSNMSLSPSLTDKGTARYLEAVKEDEEKKHEENVQRKVIQLL